MAHLLFLTETHNSGVNQELLGHIVIMQVCLDQWSGERSTRERKRNEEKKEKRGREKEREGDEGERQRGRGRERASGREWTTYEDRDTSKINLLTIAELKRPA